MEKHVSSPLLPFLSTAIILLIIAIIIVENMRETQWWSIMKNQIFIFRGNEGQRRHGGKGAVWDKKEETRALFGTEMKRQVHYAVFD